VHVTGGYPSFYFHGFNSIRSFLRARNQFAPINPTHGPSSRAAMSTPLPIPDRIRLHITPFSPALLHSYIPPSLLPEATGISYHTIQSFPEKNYGYIELPNMDAQKLKKKLNGSTLKGSKIRIEDARPEKRKAVEADEEQVIEEEKPKKKKPKKAKRDEGEIDGVVLPEGRKVKRGWTETVAEKSKERRDKKERKEKGEKKSEKRKRDLSKYTTEPECLFRTELPAGVTLAADDGKKEKKHKKKVKKEVVVHEFANTTKHASFLKSGTVNKSSKTAHEFIEGKGWVDEDGNLIEEESEFQRAKRLRLEAMETKKAAAKIEATVQAETKSKKSKKAPTPEPESSSESASSSDPSSSSESDSDSGSESDTSPLSGSPPKSATSSVPETKTPNKEIHPLEALFKRPPPPPTSDQISPSSKLAPITTTFNFFAEDEQDLEETEASQVPKTPGTRRDLEWRSVRSPAPTPDTAAVNRKFSFSAAALGRHTEEEEDDEDEIMKNVPQVNVNALEIEKDENEGEGESEFSKWFWENRGDSNRAWKKRRKEAMKVKRKRENRRLTRRII
jgi:hypothetical protein